MYQNPKGNIEKVIFIKFAEYGLAARVIHTPGHTQGSIAILTANGRIFVGDTVSNRSKPDSTPFIENEQELHDSLKILKGAKACIFYPGHGKPFTFKTFALFGK
jgi:hydroxyacylglutathione hydrolase